MRLVKVVTSTRWSALVQTLHSASRSSTWFSVGRIWQTGSIRPDGRTTCSTKTPPVRSNSQPPGVAETYIVCGRIASHSSNLRGLLSIQEGKRNPCSAKVDLRA